MPIVPHPTPGRSHGLALSCHHLQAVTILEKRLCDQLDDGERKAIEVWKSAVVPRLRQRWSADRPRLRLEICLYQEEIAPD